MLRVGEWINTQEYCICYHIHPLTKQNCIQHNVNVNSVHIALHLRKFRLFYPIFYSVLLYDTLLGACYYTIRYSVFALIQHFIRCLLLYNIPFGALIQHSIRCIYPTFYSVLLSNILFGALIQHSIRCIYPIFYSMFYPTFYSVFYPTFYSVFELELFPHSFIWENVSNQSKSLILI